MIDHLDEVDRALRAIFHRAKRAQLPCSRLLVNVELEEICNFAFEAIGAIAKAKEAAKPWWTRWI